MAQLGIEHAVLTRGLPSCEDPFMIKALDWKIKDLFLVSTPVMTSGGHLFCLHLILFFFLEFCTTVYSFLYCIHIQVPLSARLNNVTNASLVFILAYPNKEEICVIQYFNLLMQNWSWGHYLEELQLSWDIIRARNKSMIIRSGSISWVMFTLHNNAAYLPCRQLEGFIP